MRALVTHGHFLSCDKDGSHTLRSAIVENPMLHTDFTALCFIELEFIVLHCGNRDFQPDLDLVTFMYELDPYCLEMYHTGRAKMNFLHQGFQKLSSDTQTDSAEVI